MTTLAFYAPLKPPSHPVPSGDRAMARGLMQALRYGGHAPTLASNLRIFDKIGDAEWQRKLFQAAEHEADKAITLGRAEGWRAWITYHNYYKSPDLIGPVVAQALSIPYLLIEATRARKRLDGPWAGFAQAAEQACDRADAIFFLTERDAQALRGSAPEGQIIEHMRPFLPISELPTPSTRAGAMLSVGMMREGDKLASYKLIGDCLARLSTPDWHLDIAGDGPARPQVEGLMAPFGDRVRLLGELGPHAMQSIYGQASLLLWPGVNEAFGMSYLEAQAAGVPAVAQNRPGVRDVLAPGQYPSVEDGPAALAAQTDTLLRQPETRWHSACVAREYVAAHHLIPSASATIAAVLRKLGA